MEKKHLVIRYFDTYCEGKKYFDTKEEAIKYRDEQNETVKHKQLTCIDCIYCEKDKDVTSGYICEKNGCEIDDPNVDYCDTYFVWSKERFLLLPTGNLRMF